MEIKMKMHASRTIPILIILLVVVIGSAGCSNNPESDIKQPDYVYNPDVVQFPLPDSAEFISNIAVAGESVYFTATHAGHEDGAFEFLEIYTMNIDGSNIEILPNYSVAADVPEKAEEGYTFIHSMVVDKNGNIWVIERGEYFYFPEGISNNDPERWRTRVIVHEFTRVRKLDDSGAEILAFDVSHLSVSQGWFNVSAFAIDNDDNVYIGSDSLVHVLDSNGKSLFSEDVRWVESLVNTPEGAVAHLGWNLSDRVLSVFDVPGKRIGGTIKLPGSTNAVYPGNDEYSYIITDDVGLYVIDAASGNEILLLNWIESNLTPEGLDNISLLRDGRILTINRNRNREGSNHEIIILAKVPYTELPEKIEITLATFYLDYNIRSAIVEFNNTSTTHRINVIDYSGSDGNAGGMVFGDEWSAGIMRFNTEIITGNVPDIIDVSKLPVNQYISKGLLMDLYPLIDSDPDLNRSDFMESVLRETETDGGLYKIFPFFYINTMVGNPSRIGSYPGWNTEEFIAAINANPDADFPFGQGFTKTGLLQYLVMYSMDDFVNWHTGTVRFDSGEFAAFLEFANTLPDTFDWDDEIPEVELMREGRQIIRATSIDGFNTYRMYKALFGGDIVFKGYPAENRNGSSMEPGTSFAITTKCNDVDGAWAFIRTLLMDEWQYQHDWMGFPVNKNTFDRFLEETMTRNDRSPESMGWGDFSIQWKPLTEEEADSILVLIDSLSGFAGRDETIWNIISESAASYFNGQSTVQDAVTVIQNRVSIYVSEQG